MHFGRPRAGFTRRAHRRRSRRTGTGAERGGGCGTSFGSIGASKERGGDALEPGYYLRTLEWGALARTYPRPYSVWRQCGLDEDVEGGYAFVTNFFAQPNDEMLEELCDEVYGTNTGGPTDEADGGGGNLFAGIGKFIDAFQKL